MAILYLDATSYIFSISNLDKIDPVGLLGELMIITLVLFVTIFSNSSDLILKLLSSFRGRLTALAPKKLTIEKYETKAGSGIITSSPEFTRHESAR